ncbi:hypothetical protein HDU99_005370 [Rhizoclosmatium hyalinum]|nr:hypothetical protein HDU99_005370 [Rhizoclosmatium hyalinum]
MVTKAVATSVAITTMDIRNLNISGVPYLFYGVIPDITSALCFNGKTCGPYNAFQNTCLIASHELFEAITNPMVGVAHNGARYPVAWYSVDDKNTSGEFADMCKDIGFEIEDEDGSKWVIQTVWSNKAQRCVAAPV